MKQQQPSIDLNCDTGEYFSAHLNQDNSAILDYVSSANIACGFHAGDPGAMRETVERALAKGVAIGAHPGLPDLMGFGRRKMDVKPAEVYDMMVYQIGALRAIVDVAGGRLHHIKPHGALYNMVSVDATLARAAAQAVYDVDSNLCLYAFAGSELAAQGRALGLMTWQEGFADRTYEANGSLMNRSKPNALIHDEEMVVAQVLSMVHDNQVTSAKGEKVPLQVETICIHGDTSGAVNFARKLQHILQSHGIKISAVIPSTR